jgi:hypothetical protein
VIVLTYVDDNFCVGEKNALKQMLKEVVEQGLKITVEEMLTDYLSCEIRLDPSKKKAWIGQPHMVKKIIKTFEEEVNKRSYVDTPGTPGLSLIKEIDDGKKVPQELQSRY